LGYRVVLPKFATRAHLTPTESDESITVLQLRGSQMAKATKAKGNKKKPIEQYNHKGKKRANNPPVGLVTPQTDKESGRKTYAYDPHLDPQLVWAGKAERTSFEVPTVSLHVHERIDPRTIYR
jgi:hypothetical protein